MGTPVSSVFVRKGGIPLVSAGHRFVQVLNMNRGFEDVAEIESREYFIHMISFLFLNRLLPKRDNLLGVHFHILFYPASTSGQRGQHVIKSLK